MLQEYRFDLNISKREYYSAQTSTNALLKFKQVASLLYHSELFRHTKSVYWTHPFHENRRARSGSVSRRRGRAIDSLVAPVMEIPQG